jgi:hypothetical protein
MSDAAYNDDDTVDDEDSWYVDVVLADSRLGIAGLDGLAIECYGNSPSMSTDGKKMRFFFDDEEYADSFALFIQLNLNIGISEKK